MSTELIRDLYGYHHWANRRLFDVAAGLGDAAVARDMGKHWSVPTLKGMFAHIYGADTIWLTRWRGTSPSRIPGDADFASMADLRARWDALESEQRAFVDGLDEAGLARVVSYKNTEGAQFNVALGRAPAARGQPRDPSPERGRHHDHPHQRVPAGHRDQHLSHRGGERVAT